MQAVGQFDDNHAYVAGHGQNKLAKALGLVFRLIVVFEFFQLGETVYHVGDGIAEFGGQFDFGSTGIFQNIMHQAGAERLDIHMPFGQLGGYCNRMGDVGFAAFAGLAVVCVKSIGASFLQLDKFVFT